MKLLKIALMIPLVAAALPAESQTHTYAGDIVTAKCLQAASIVNRNSRGYTPTGVSTFTGSRYKPLNTASMRKSILQHCVVNPGSTEFGLVDDQGNFYVLDETGNRAILEKTDSQAKKIRVTVTGSVDHEMLVVE